MNERRMIGVVLVLCAFSLLVTLLFVAVEETPGPREPVSAFVEGKLIDCYEREALPAPDILVTAAKLDDEDMALIFSFYPGFIYRPDLNEGERDEIVFVRYVDVVEKNVRVAYMLVTREKDGGYCIRDFINGPTEPPYPFEEVFTEKYKGKSLPKTPVTPQG